MDYSIALTPVQTDHFRIDLFIPVQEEVRATYTKLKAADATAKVPFWATVWPACLVLSDFLEQHPEYIRDKNVLELAAGLGIPSFIAARYARQVCCSDYLEEPVAVMQKSVDHNGLSNVSCAILDWNHLPEELYTTTDVVLLSDVNYEPAAFEQLYKVFQAFIEQGTLVLLTTGQRLMARPFIERLLPWCRHQEEKPVHQDGQDYFVSLLVLHRDESFNPDESW